MNDSIPHTRIEKLLLEAGRIFNSTLDYEELISLILNLVITAANAEAALVYRFDPERPEMKIRYMKSGTFKMESVLREKGSGVVGWVAENREPLILNQATGDKRIDRDLEQVMGISFRNMVSLPLVGHGRMIGIVEAINKIGGEFDNADLDTLTGLNHQIAVAINNANLYREVKQEALEKNLLYQIGKKLSETLILNEVLEAILELLREAVDYTVGGVFLIDEHGVDMRSIYTVGYEATNQIIHVKAGQGIVGAAALSGEAVIVKDVNTDDRYFKNHVATRSEVAVPVKIDDRVIGVINLESDKLDVFNKHDLSLITAFASQAAIAVERARLHESLLEARQLEEQLNVAREIQRSFLPKADPDLAGYEVTGRNIPSGQVGGDYYDFIRIVGNHYGIAIADVSGKGIPAALIMASFRASLIAEIRNNYSIRTIGEKVNSLMCESLEPGNFVTGVYGVLDAKNHIFTFSNFGHNPPVLLRVDGEIEYLREGGPVFGVTNSAVFEERALFINPGDVLVMYTDGVTEVFDENGKEFGMEGLTEVLLANKGQTARQIADAIYKATYQFARPDYVFDDLTMIVLRRLPKQTV